MGKRGNARMLILGMAACQSDYDTTIVEERTCVCRDRQAGRCLVFLFFELETRDFHLDVGAGVGVAHAI